MIFFFNFILAKYFPSKWDPLVKETEVYKQIKDIRGWLPSHINKVKVDTFGDLSILTFNLYSRGMSDSTSSQVTAITQLLDKIHPSILFLQGVDSELMERLKTIARGSKHYFLINTVKFSTDLGNGEDYYLPIFYDARVFTKKASGYFTTNGTDIKILYASWARFKSPKTEFTAINLDLFSTYKNVTNAMFANIVSDIKSDKITNSFPVVFGGTIISMPQSLEELIDNEYKDLLKADKNNIELSKTTMHIKGALKDEVTRDYIILRDKFGSFYLNYARILSDFPQIGNHYPVHAILSLSERPTLKKASDLSNVNRAYDALRSLDKNTEKKYVNQAIKDALNAAGG